MTSRWEQGSVVTGFGFLGRYAVEALALDGWRVRAAVRRPELAGHLQPLGEVGQIYAVQANVRYPDTVARAMTSAEAVVNLAGIRAEQGRQTFEAVHVAGARWREVLSPRSARAPNPPLVTPAPKQPAKRQYCRSSPRA